MCGIAGIVSHRPVADPDLLRAGRDTMRHRGPDDAGIWWSEDRAIGLAHRRLSIIDLSAAASQPMHASASDCVLIFNGEIYNYRELRVELRAKGHTFRTSSDTEVVIESYRAWGAECVRRFNGMFALALWDRTRRRLLLARDRAGEKPVFFIHHNHELAFASELKALLVRPDLPRTVDRIALDHYLAYGYVPRERCILHGFNKLPPAHALIYEPDHDRLQVEPYWDLPERTNTGAYDPVGLVDELEQLFADSVKRQLVADVPVAILLSGGTDSSLVTAMAARVSPEPVRTFTVSMSGQGSFDEAPYARIVAERFSTRHTELTAEPSTVELLPLLARQYDEPLGDSSMVPTYLVSRQISEHCKVALGGDGGDELFGGYTHHAWLLQQERVRTVVPQLIRRGVGLALETMVPVGVKGRNYVMGYIGERTDAVVHAMRFFTPDARARLVRDSNGAIGVAERERLRFDVPGQSVLQQMTAIDFRHYLPDDILVKVDRASMLTSLEVRAPWLDYRIIEFAYGRVPDALRATPRAKKILPRMLGARLLPPELDLKRKQGFSIPLQRWFKGEWGAYVTSVLLDSRDSPFDRAEVEQLIGAQQRGFAHTNRLFALAMFELWRREYRISI